MPFRPLPSFPGGLLPVLFLLGLAPLAPAGLASSLVRADMQTDSDPDTTTWNDDIDLFAGPVNMLSDFASLNGDMAVLSFSVAARISNISNDRSSSTGSEVAFVDAITLDAPGIDSGTDLIVTVAWKVSGSDSVTNDSSLYYRAGSSLLLDGPGFQDWQRSIFDPGADDLDPFGTVQFSFPIKAGTPEPENIRLLLSAAGEITPRDIIFPTTYDVEAEARMTVTFCGITDVRTTGGTRLGLWTVTADSGLDYGEGTEAPVLTDPVLSIGPSPSGADFVRLSWPSSILETYSIESTDGVEPWRNDATCSGEDGMMFVDLEKSGPARIYKLLNDFTP